MHIGRAFMKPKAMSTKFIKYKGENKSELKEQSTHSQQTPRSYKL